MPERWKKHATWYVTDAAQVGADIADAECGLLLAARPVRAGFLTRVPSRLNELRKVLSYRQEPDASVYSLVMPTGVSKSPLLLLFCTGQRYNLPAGPSRV
ncbi:TPA: hypothetical protein ACH3X2_008536 [Trebouxia sp. C0005]